ncbi:MAG: response regulator transcription factor [Flavobacteriales bacterium]|nr:response regulator transcription factor [Flavobacteriales bacterium]
MKEAYKILIVDDERDLVEMLEYNLKKEGFEVFCAFDGVEAVRLAKKIIPDLILLDVMMPEMDGVEACVEIGEDPTLSNTIIAFLTARGEDYSQIAGLDSGADDYITKPIKPRVLISRIHALLRRKKNNPANSETEIPALEIDRERYLVLKAGVEISLPKKEFELLALRNTKPGKVYTREVILHTVWGEDVVVGDRTIDVHIRKLREKIGDDLIKTIKGVGYKLDLE